MNFTAKHIPFRQACAFIAAHHRHHKPPQGCIVCIGLFQAAELVGVAVIGRPVSRMIQARGDTVELTRLCVLEDVPFAASALQARARRVAQALGYSKLITYTLPEEGGASLRAAGAVQEGEAGGGQWTRPSRGRALASDEITGRKIRSAWALRPDPVNLGVFA